MHRLRHLLVLRLGILGLLFGLGLSLVPVAVAAESEGLEERYPGLPDSVRASLPTGVPASLDALEAALTLRLGDAAAAEALLRALYGELLRIYRYDLGQNAVLVSASVGTAGSSPSAAFFAPSSPGAFEAACAEAARFECQAERPTPRVLFPAVQPLGP